MVGGSESTPTIKFYGVSSSGEETLLNTWESTTSNVSYFDAGFEDAQVDQYKGKVFWDKTKPDGTPKKQLDINAIRSLGWEPKISLDIGIANTIEDFKKNYLKKKQIKRINYE